MGGHVFKRKGQGGLPIEGGRSDLFIAEEMVSGQSEAAFDAAEERSHPSGSSGLWFRGLGAYRPCVFGGGAD